MTRVATTTGKPLSLWMPSATLVLWTFTLTIGIVGLSWPRRHDTRAEREVSRVPSELLTISLTEEEPLLAAVRVSPRVPTHPSPPSAPPPAALPSLAPAPRLESVMEPPSLPEFPSSTRPMPSSPTSAVSSMSPVADSKASSSPPSSTGGLSNVPSVPGVSAEAPVQTLRYGEGEGRQPAPEYPASARREGQQGTVSVRFTVGTDGRVITAEAVRPGPWPLLTRAALDVIQHRWRFKVGDRRVFEVSIRFQISR